MFDSKRALYTALRIGSVVWVANLWRLFFMPDVFAGLEGQTWHSYYWLVTATVNAVIAVGLISGNRGATTTSGVFAYEAGIIIALSIDWVRYAATARTLYHASAAQITMLVMISVTSVVIARALVRRRLTVRRGRSRVL